MMGSCSEKKITYIIIIIGSVLSLIQFLYNRSLWLDEAYLALNITSKSHAELLRPLEFRQVAPILFLQGVKLFSVIFGDSEFGLRLFPLISFIASPILFYRILLMIHKNNKTIIFSLSVFSLNITTLYYASELKQYSTDLLVCLLLFYFTLKLDITSQKKYRYVVFGFIGSVGIFLSNVTPIILFTVFLYISYSMYKEKIMPSQDIVFVFFLWGVVFIIYYFLFVKGHPAREGMIREWMYYKGFMPLNPFDKSFFVFLYKKLGMIIHSLFSFGKTGGVILLVLMLAGFISLIRSRKNEIIIIVVSPILLHLILSGFQLYPFDKRLVLYTIPSVIILASYGFDAIIGLKPLKAYQSITITLLIPVLLLINIYYQGFPSGKIEIKENLLFIREVMENNDIVYIDYFGRVPFFYYEKILSSGNVVIGEKASYWNGQRWDGDTLVYKNELEKLMSKKQKTWFLFTSVGDGEKRKYFMRDFLGKKGVYVVCQNSALGSDVYLYDLSK